MQLLPQLETKSIFDAEPGELVAMELRRHRAIAIVVEQHQMECWLVVLHSTETLSPSPPIALAVNRRQGSKPVLSYGSNWVIELIPGDESYPGNTAAYQVPGVIYVDVDGPRLYSRAREASGFEEGTCVDLANTRFVDLADSGTPHLHWRIWESSDERQRTSTSPILEFSATQVP